MKMCLKNFLLFLLVVGAIARTVKQKSGTTEEDARIWLIDYDVEMAAMMHKYICADWDYNTDITDHNAQLSLAAAAELAALAQEKGLDAKKFDYTQYEDESIIRQLKMITNLGTAALDPDEVNQFNQLVNGMNSLYSVAKICPPDNRDCNIETEGMSLEPDIESFIVNSKSYSDLTYVWSEWREASGKLMKDDYFQYIVLGNEAAKRNGFADYGQMWIDPYQMDMNNDFKEEIERLWLQVLPLYEQLHAYVRHKLRTFYGDAYVMEAKDPVPAHIFGNMWAQSWENIYEMVKPFDTSELDITDALQEQGYDAVRIFNTSDEFFISIGHEKTPASFWDLSMLVKPTDREVVCHASAWDFLYNKDVRIKQCTEINMEDFITVHHEMGHTQYFLLYDHQPLSFREGANPGFHEAVGDTISLAVQTPQHLYTVNLLDEPEDTYEFNINYLLKIALGKVAFLPFGYLIDLYRWDLFSGVVNKDQSNAHWWKLREQYQGLVPPSQRTINDFDAGAKYHVPSDVPYIRYFVAHIMQFELYKAACEVAGKYPEQPLHKCDYYKSKEAGGLLRKGLEYGASQPWPETLKLMTGRPAMSAEPLLEYFQPLREFLEEYNTLNNVEVGWNIGKYEEWVE